MKRILLLLLTTVILQFSYTDEEFKDVNIYMANFGPGDGIPFRWGHFGVMVDYPEDSTQNDIIYDYGNFSPTQKNFYTDFISGIMNYYKLSKNAERFLDSYLHENRTILLRELNFTNEQKKQYIEKLNWDILPENRVYQYDQFGNNCVSEVVKDLNIITDGDFLKGTSNKIGRTHRDLVRDYISSNYPINILLNLVMGSKVDYNITEEQSLFLPDYAGYRADEVFLTDSDGNKRPLVKNKVLIYEGIGRDKVITNAKPRIFISIITGLLLAGISVLLSINYKIKAISDILIGLILTFCGSVLFFMSFFTGHYYIHNNWNLLFLNPLSVIIMISAIMRITKKGKTSGQYIYEKFVDTTLLLTVAMIVLKSIGLIVQENSEIILICLPILLVNSSFKTLLPLSRKNDEVII